MSEAVTVLVELAVTEGVGVGDDSAKTVEMEPTE